MHNACRSEHANFIWVAQEPKGGSVTSRSGSDSESPSDAVASADAEIAGKTGCGTDVAAQVPAVRLQAG